MPEQNGHHYADENFQMHYRYLENQNKTKQKKFCVWL